VANIIMSAWLDTMEDYGFDDLERSTLARLIDDSHKENCLREPWPFLERQETITQSAGNNTVSTTATLGKILAFVNTDDEVALTPLRTDTQLKDYVYDLNETGIPTHYYFIADQLYLWPTPDGSKTLKIRFLTEPTTLTKDSDDSDILWPAKHDSVILYGALSKAYYINDDPQGAAMQQVMEARLQIARADLWSKQFDRTDRVVVLDDNDYLF
jgi:hypothetical protein